MNFAIEELDKNIHDRHSFDCGISELNTFLKAHANQNQLKNISRSYVAVSQGSEQHSEITPKIIAGYYTLSSGQIFMEQLPSTVKVKLPKYPVPIARIARLAVNKSHQGQGVGGYLLHHACINILAVSKKMGIFAVVVDAKNDNAKLFYKNYGFMELQNSTFTLFLPTDTISEAKN